MTLNLQLGFYNTHFIITYFNICRKNARIVQVFPIGPCLHLCTINILTERDARAMVEAL